MKFGTAYLQFASYYFFLLHIINVRFIHPVTTTACVSLKRTMHMFVIAIVWIVVGHNSFPFHSLLRVVDHLCFSSYSWSKLWESNYISSPTSHYSYPSGVNILFNKKAIQITSNQSQFQHHVLLQAVPFYLSKSVISQPVTLLPGVAKLTQNLLIAQQTR